MDSQLLWKEARDNDDRVYYFNSKTGESTWDKPNELLSEQERILAKYGWKSSRTPDGKEYYYNLETKKSTWKLPELSEISELKMDISHKAESSKTSNDIESDVASEIHKYTNPSEILHTCKKSKEEAEQEFIQMLKDNQVDSTWSFSKVISDLASKDPRYWMVEDDPLYRQQLFEKYFTNRSEEQLLKERMETSKFGEAFWKMLMTKPELRYYTRWSTAKRLIANEPIYKHSVVRESVKKQKFLEYVDNLRKEFEDSQRKLKTQALKELQDYLENILLFSDTKVNGMPIMKWHQLANNYLFEKNRRYMANKHFKILTREDVLQVYLDILSKVEKEWRDKLVTLDQINYTKDRIARDGFKQLLRSSDLKIRADSRWQDIYPIIKNDQRFLEMLGTGGSSPLDLFLDVVEEKSIAIAAHRSIAQNVLIEKGFQWDEDDNDRQIIKDNLRGNEQFSDVDDYDLNLVINQLTKLQNEKQRKQKLAEHNSFEEKKHFFMSMLRRVYGAIKPKHLSWETALRDIQNTREYYTLTDVHVKRQLFDEFLASNVSPVRSRLSPFPNPKKRQLGPDVELDY